ncbi:MAG: dihydrofolate reductase [Culicoidibacterales bacterium]
MLSMIVATDLENGIGLDNKMPWHYPVDFAYFKQITTGHTIIMGRKTFESIGHPLPNRKNLVISRNLLAQEGIEVIDDPMSYFEAAQHLIEEVFIIGGGSVYELALPYTNRIYRTEIQKKYATDCKFLEIPLTEFEQTARVEKGELHFVTYERIEIK